MSYPIDQHCLRLLLVRHGQTGWNSIGRFMGQKDIPLNETGFRQAAAAAHRLQNERTAVIFTSDLQRAWQTASSIQQAIDQRIKPDPPPPLVADPRLREMCFGDWEGLTYTEIENSDAEILKAWQADFWNYSPPGGESMKDLEERVSQFLDEMLNTYQEGVAVVVAHGGTLESMAMKLLKITPDRFLHFYTENTGISEFEVYPAGAILVRWNDTSHLKLLDR